MTKIQRNFGGISMLVLVLGVSVAVTIGGLVLVAATQYTSSLRTDVFERALTIAQSGAEYYRWHLAHNPTDFTDGTGLPGPYVHTISDPYGGTEGSFSLTITPPASGSSIVTISSEGSLTSNPEIKRTVTTRYGIPSLARFSFLHNANVWFGNNITVNGSVMSNGGIRMDGTNTSTVQSLQQTYVCGSETGCTSQSDCINSTPERLFCSWNSALSRCECDGVWGSGGPQALWEYPVPQVDFNALTVDFSTMRTAAQNNGTYMGPSGSSYGYHVVFTNDGNYTIRRINSANNRRGWSVENGCENLYQVITSETTLGTYSIATDPIIFLEDYVFVEGVVNGRATLVAARFPIDVYNMNIWIPNNLTYIAKDGHSSLGLFAQNNIYYGLNVPTNFEINAALLAQRGRIIRHHYRYSGCSNYTDAVRNSLTIYGSVISNQKSYWNFGTGPSSGFITRTVTYDTNSYFDPPPYFPAQGEYEFISWEER